MNCDGCYSLTCLNLSNNMGDMFFKFNKNCKIENNAIKI